MALLSALSGSASDEVSGTPLLDLLESIATAYDWSSFHSVSPAVVKDVGRLTELLGEVVNRNTGEKLDTFESSLLLPLFSTPSKVLTQLPALALRSPEEVRDLAQKAAASEGLEGLLADGQLDVLVGVVSSIPATHLCCLGIELESGVVECLTFKSTVSNTKKRAAAKRFVSKLIPALHSCGSSKKEDLLVTEVQKTAIAALVGSRVPLKLLSDAPSSVLPSEFDLDGHDIEYWATRAAGTWPTLLTEALGRASEGSHHASCAAFAGLMAANVVSLDVGFKIGTETRVEEEFVSLLNKFHASSPGGGLAGAGTSTAGGGTAGAGGGGGPVKVKLLEQSGKNEGSGGQALFADFARNLKVNLSARNSSLFADFTRLRLVFSPFHGREVHWPTVVGETKTHSSSILGAVPQYHAYVCAVLRGLLLVLDRPCHLGRIVAGGCVRYFASWLDVDPATGLWKFHTVPVSEAIHVTPPGSVDKATAYDQIGRFEEASAWLAEQQEGVLEGVVP